MSELRNAEDLANGLSVPRHGIERLRWLQEQWVWPEGVTPPADYPKHAALGAERTNIEVAFALIEELHDAIKFWSSPAIVIK